MNPCCSQQMAVVCGCFMAHFTNGPLYQSQFEQVTSQMTVSCKQSCDLSQLVPVEPWQFHNSFRRASKKPFPYLSSQGCQDCQCCLLIQFSIAQLQASPSFIVLFNSLNPELNPICYLLALLGAHHFLHVSRIRVKLLSFRLLMSYIYIWCTHS